MRGSRVPRRPGRDRPLQPQPPTPVPSDGHVHYWMLDKQDKGICRDCGNEKSFASAFAKDAWAHDWLQLKERGKENA